MRSARAALLAPLEDPEHATGARTSTTELLRTWRWPSFSSWDTWLFLNVHSGSSGRRRSFVRRLRWRSDLDEQRLRAAREPAGRFTATPTIEVTERDHDPSELAARLERLESIGLKALAPSRFVTLDGVRVGLSIPGHLTTSWSAVPSGWEELDAWIREQQAWLDLMF